MITEIWKFINNYLYIPKPDHSESLFDDYYYTSSFAGKDDSEHFDDEGFFDEDEDHDDDLKDGSDSWGIDSSDAESIPLSSDDNEYTSDYEDGDYELSVQDDEHIVCH